MHITATLIDDLARALVQKSGKTALRIVEASAKASHVADDPEKARLTAAVADRLKHLLPHKGNAVNILV